MVKVLGQRVDAPTHYAPEILERIVRQPRDSVTGYGFDIWHLYELSWLVESGSGEVGSSHYVGVLTIPADSAHTVESKSLKLYLNSLNFHKFASDDQALICIRADLEVVLGVRPDLAIVAPSDIHQITREPVGELLDGLVEPAPSANDLANLQQPDGVMEEVSLVTHRLRSLCPVTAQPDWATLAIRYTGTELNRSALMAYVDSFREHKDFHERCIETIFNQLCHNLTPTNLVVSGYFQRRGGIDITPHRSMHPTEPSLHRMGRQ